MVIRVILTSPDLQLDSDGIGLRPNSIVSLLPIDLISTGLCCDASMLQCYDDLTSTDTCIVHQFSFYMNFTGHQLYFGRV